MYKPAVQAPITNPDFFFFNNAILTDLLQIQEFLDLISFVGMNTTLELCEAPIYKKWIWSIFNASIYAN